MRLLLTAMSYSLSAAKLQTYQRCPQSYYFRYERKIQGAAFFGSAALGTSLHQALASIYKDWHYQDPIPRFDWVEQCWNQQTKDLTPQQVSEGRTILRRYYNTFIATESSLRKPLGVEGKVQGTLWTENMEFTLTGRYDRLDYLDDGLELIDYKSSREVDAADTVDIDLQIGLYYLALEQRYSRVLKRLSLLYLRSSSKVSFEVTPDHRSQVETVIAELASQLRYDRQWAPVTGDHCDRCAYARYCPAVRAKPDPLPEDAKPEPGLQLVLSL